MLARRDHDFGRKRRCFSWFLRSEPLAVIWVNPAAKCFCHYITPSLFYCRQPGGPVVIPVFFYYYNSC